MDETKEYVLSNDWHGKIVEFSNLRTGYNLELSGGSADPGTTVVSMERSNAASQHWKLFKVDVDSARSTWIIQNVCSETWLDIQDSNTYDGAKIHCWPLSWEQARDNKNGNWYITTTSKGDVTPIIRLCGVTSLTYINATPMIIWNVVQGWHRVDADKSQYWTMSVVQ